MIRVYNCLTRPQVFTLADNSTLRLTARGTNGYHKEVLEEKISREVRSAAEKGLIIVEEIQDPTVLNEIPTIEKKTTKKLKVKED